LASGHARRRFALHGDAVGAVVRRGRDRIVAPQLADARRSYGINLPSSFKIVHLIT